MIGSKSSLFSVRLTKKMENVTVDNVFFDRRMLISHDFCVTLPLRRPWPRTDVVGTHAADPHFPALTIHFSPSNIHFSDLTIHFPAPTIHFFGLTSHFSPVAIHSKIWTTAYT